MKKGIHPDNYRLVAFKDMSNNDVFITKSAVETKDTIKHDGVDYPLVKLEISRTSHPYYTGKTKLVDTAGRIDKFKNRYAGLSLKKMRVQNRLKLYLLRSLLLKPHLLRSLLLKPHLLRSLLLKLHLLRSLL